MPDESAAQPDGCQAICRRALHPWSRGRQTGSGTWLAGLFGIYDWRAKLRDNDVPPPGARQHTHHISRVEFSLNLVPMLCKFFRQNEGRSAFSVWSPDFKSQVARHKFPVRFNGIALRVSLFEIPPDPRFYVG